ncbi:Fic family protein [Fibrella forsythiae]|uniref:Fic family protein n=1 Tax=Fibrella forsythiae TaxID=2817061 RepID=A0ABS3JTH2_9BACT|nr:Fic family protein [Fibrella forsythiae]MBO0953306.1 Fic family protein [Fibrella forsythiae]
MSFEDKLQFDFLTMQEVIRRIGLIDAFRGKWEALEQKNNRYLRELRRVATIESIGSSTRIEGAVLTNQEVEKLVRNVKITEFKTRDEQEVFGYYEALDLILEHAREIDLTEAYLKQLHGILLRYSDKDQRHRGGYKNLSNQVVANYPDGTQRVIFNATAPHLTEPQMQQMVDWVANALEKRQIHPLLVIGLFVYEFLSIHPFQDGNGRLSRLLTTLLLLKVGYDFAQYVSFEHIIEQRKADYYRALMAGQQHRGGAQETIGTWMVFFLDCLQTLTDRLTSKYALYKDKGGYLNARQQRVVAQVLTDQPVKLGDLARSLADVSINTLKKDLHYLVQQGSLDRLGEGKATVYWVAHAAQTP